MNILLVTMEMNVGGAETHVLELAKALAKDNNVYVISAGGRLVDELEQNGVSHIYAPLKDKKPSHVFQAFKTLKKTIIEEKIDVVHAHARIPGAICGMVCKQTKTRFVTTIHGMYRVNFLLKLLTNWGEKTLAVSNDIGEHAIKEYKLKRENVLITVNGINTERFKKSNDNKTVTDIDIEEGKLKVVHVSRLDRESIQVAQTLIDVADELEKEITDGVQIIIVGAGNAYEELKAKASEKRNVKLTGARMDVNKILNYADVFVGVSRAAMEAMATEVPVVLAGNISYGQGYQGIFDESKLEAAIETNFTCRGFKEIDRETLKKEIIFLLKNNDENMGKYNRQIVEKYYSVDKMVEDAKKAYEIYK